MESLVARIVALLGLAMVVAIVGAAAASAVYGGAGLSGLALAFSRVDAGVTLTHDVVFDLILPPLLFEAALNLPWRELRRDWPPILALSTLGVLLCAALVTAGLVALLQWPLRRRWRSAR